MHVRIAQHLQPARGRRGEFLHQRLAPRRHQPDLRRHADDLRIKTVSDNQPLILGQQLYGEIRVHRKKETVRLIQIALPFRIRGEIRAA